MEETTPETPNSIKIATTPAGSRINADWGQLRAGVGCLAVFLRGVASATARAASAAARAARTSNEWHVVFRCGTVVRVSEGDPEFVGYSAEAYRFPGHRAEETSTAKEIMADNLKVWGVQKGIAGPVGRAIRQGYAKMLAQGYPYPGGPPADRSAVHTGLTTEDNGAFWMVFWPNLDRKKRVYNLAFSKKGAEAAAIVGGELRRYDYMFPEVAAVITPAPTMKVWTYGPDNVFSKTYEI